MMRMVGEDGPGDLSTTGHRYIRECAHDDKDQCASRIQALPSSPLKIVMERLYASISRFFLSIPFSERKKRYGCSAVPTGNIEES